MLKVETMFFMDCSEEDSQATLTSAKVNVTEDSMRAGQGVWKDCHAHNLL